ncbi:MAG TPA: prepilin-type N-terminal cleavage/methylation domain-containing protein [Gemmatimonadaceae bacterium]|nr:prepilin-type N-terminal cleavage/methylation domain-containing protein [Gemmatimonadaceae bacterium]
MPRANGFTLMEVVVALLIGSIVLVAAHAMLSALSDRERALAAAAVVADGRANGKETLRALVGNIEVGTPGTGSVAGDNRQVHFSSWCDVPYGWQERCEVALSFDSAAGHEALVANIGARPVVLVRGFEHGSFQYLQSAAGGGRWLEQWGAGVTAPLAIGAVLRYHEGTDTLILRIGPRG